MQIGTLFTLNLEERHMLNKKCINDLRKLLLVIDISFFLMVVLYCPAGFAWLDDETDTTDERGEQTMLSSEEIKHQVHQLADEKKRLQHELNLRLAQATELKEEYKQMKQLGLDPNTLAAAEAKQQVQKKNEELSNKVRDKQKQLEALEKEKFALEELLCQSRNMDKRKAQITEQLRELEGKNIRLKDKIAEIKRKQLEGRTLQVQSTPMVNLNTERGPKYVSLSKATIVPVCEPYYTFSRLIVPCGDGQYEQVTKVSQNGHPGESVDEALSEGSNLFDFLEKIETSKDFVALLVDSSSFETFRAVRELLRRRDIPFGWIPCTVPSSFYLCSGGGIPVREFR
jgi:hypothetical protein